jgi:dihydrofolate reductase
MLHNQKIIFVSIVDDRLKMVEGLGVRIWHHETFVKKLLQRENCLLGRKTFNLTHWRGPNSWVLTRNQNWSMLGIGAIHDIDDVHLHSEGPLYVLGGQSLFLQLGDYVDEIHLYTINNQIGNENWISVDMKNWKPKDYHDDGVWSYVHLIKQTKI